LLDLFCRFVSVSLKRDLNAVEEESFLPQYIIFCQKMKTDGSICGEKDGIDRE
jgi:hypothetical protein